MDLASIIPIPFRRGQLIWLALVATAFFPQTVRSAPTVDFELVTESAFPIGGAQKWVELFSRIGESSIRIRQGQPNDRESIENRGTATQPAYHVVGILTSRNRLLLPGGDFGPGDRARIQAWIQKLREDGADAPTAKTGAFGLTDEQLVAFHDKLSVPIRCQTRGRRAGDVARDIVHSASVEFSVSEAARDAFRSDDVFGDALESMSSGTALAVVIRPLGLVMRPEKLSGGKVRLRICGLKETEEAWPIGWPPEEIPAKVAPSLFERLKVTIKEQPLPVVLAAIQPRVKIPFLLDYSSLATHQIDPSAARVSFTKESDTYQRILSSVFYQAKLTSDLRVDEAGAPFLWITTR